MLNETDPLEGADCQEQVSLLTSHSDQKKAILQKLFRLFTQRRQFVNNLFFMRSRVILSLLFPAIRNSLYSLRLLHGQ